MKIVTVVETVKAEIECPRCHARHMLIEGDKATCRSCSNVWNWRETRKEFKG